jgi:hypothetical protein
MVNFMTYDDVTVRYFAQRFQDLNRVNASWTHERTHARTPARPLALKHARARARAHARTGAIERSRCPARAA